jgi:hypothetical protein
MKEGLIYCVRNPLFPHLVKIGKTTKNTVEARGLNAANVPEDFETLFAYKVENIDTLEKLLHDALEYLRYTTESNRKTEFFYLLATEKAKKIIKSFVIADLTNSQKQVFPCGRITLTRLERKILDTVRSILKTEIKDVSRIEAVPSKNWDYHCRIKLDGKNLYAFNRDASKDALKQFEFFENGQINKAIKISDPNDLLTVANKAAIKQGLRKNATKYRISLS